MSGLVRTSFVLIRVEILGSVCIGETGKVHKNNSTPKSEGTSLGSQRVGWYVEVCVWWGTALVLSVFLLFSPHWCPPPPSALRMFARATLMCMSAAFYHTLSFWSEFPWRNITIWMRSIARQQYVLDYPAWWSERREHSGRRDFKVP